MVIMSRDVVEVPPSQRLYQCAGGPGLPRAATPTHHSAVIGFRQGENPVELSLPPPTEDTYLLRSAADKKDVMVYIDDDARVRGKIYSACPPTSAAVGHLRSSSFCLIPPNPPLNGKRPSKGRQSSVESAPPTVRADASMADRQHLEETNATAPAPLTPDGPDRRLPTSSSCSHRGIYWAAVSDASETSDQPPSNWASFDLSLSDCPLRLPPSDTACDLTMSSAESPTPVTSDGVVALSVEEFDPLSSAVSTAEQPSSISETAAVAQKAGRCPSSSPMLAFRSLGSVVEGGVRMTADLRSWAAARRLPPPPPSALLGRRVRQASASIANGGPRLLPTPTASSLSPLDDRSISVTAVYGDDESTAVSPTTTLSGTHSTNSTPQTSRQLSRRSRRATTAGGGSREDDGHNCRTSGCRRIRINISGQRFETRLRVLDRHPLTMSA